MSEIEQPANEKLTDSEAVPAPSVPAAPVGGRGPRGRFGLGNTDSLKDGSRSRRRAAELFVEAAAALVEQEQSILQDLGGPAEVSETRTVLVRRFVQAGAIADSLARDFISHGVTTAAGRTRRSVGTYLAVLDRLHRLAGAIGLERRTRNLSALSAAEYAALQQERER
jgi:hypothetical protein